MGLSKKVKVMKVRYDKQHRSDMMNSMRRPCTCGSSKSEWRAYLSQARYCVKKQSSCTRRCMMKSQVSLEVQDGNVGSARGTEYATCP